ncbi:MAG: peptide-methionine (S)-S-oxide reductase [Dehalococcoidales bacterium]|nr:peptide-methionine (S)-S-oxide reductase [Dehalococcoidales bacterium]
MDGVIRTRVGYAGGTTDSPAYYNIGDHSETVQIDYDPAKISYTELLDIFWDSHSPVFQSWSRQYQSIIFCHDEEQKKQASASLQREEAATGQKIYTEVVPLTNFYAAEDYHQKYYLQQESAIFKEFKAIYPEISRLTGSTAAARVNGYLGGYGSLELLRKQIDFLGLSLKGKERLLEIGSRLLPDSIEGLATIPCQACPVDK